MKKTKKLEKTVNNRRYSLIPDNEGLTGKIDVDRECGYPTIVSIKTLYDLYERDGLANRIVSLYPDECWQVEPEVYDVEGVDESEFEKAFTKLQRDFNLWSFLNDTDIISGIGRYGIIFIGLDDGESYDEPITGNNHELLFLRCFDETDVELSDFENDITNPRYGLPNYYTVKMSSDYNRLGSSEGVVDNIKIHHSRVIHVTENSFSNPLYGRPRLVPVLNYVLNSKMIIGGSATMYWKGALNGLSFESQQGIINTKDIDDRVDDIETMVAEYFNKLRRYIVTSGMTVRPLAPTVVSPVDHWKVQLNGIASTIGVPTRILIGSESGQMASVDDRNTWNGRISKRQRRYITPGIIRPLIKKFIELGLLPKPTNGEFNVMWSDVDILTKIEKAGIAKTVTEALATYVNGNVSEIITLRDYMITVQKFAVEEVDAFIENKNKELSEIDTDDDNLIAKNLIEHHSLNADVQEPQNTENFVAKRGGKPSESTTDTDKRPDNKKTRN